MKVVLAPSEMMQAALVAVMRQVTNIRDGRRHAHGLRDELTGWGAHIEGACGEYAVAKALGVFWNGALGDLRADDVGQLQVRATPRADGCLLLHDTDPDDRAFVLVTGALGEYVVRGWVSAADGKQRRYWRDTTGRPCYFVPQSALRPMTALQVAA